MNSRERILTALNHKEPDHVPRDLGGTDSSGITAYAYVSLNSYLGVKAVPVIFDPYQYIAYIDKHIRNKYAIDVVVLYPEPEKWVIRNNPHGFNVKLPEKWNEKQHSDGSTSVVNNNGVVIARCPGAGFYFDSINPPLQNLSDIHQLNDYKDIIFSFDWPFFADESLENMTERAKKLYSSGKCVVFNLACHLLAAGQALRGYENFMVDLLSNKSMALHLLELLIEGYEERIAKLSPLLKSYIDVVLLNDDLGTQYGPMISPDLYRKIIKPFQKRLFSYVKKSFKKPLLLHSCGSVSQFIPDLLEIGVDALNPVQISAQDMSPEKLKKTFGSSITFWGGGIDTQSVLNHGSVEEVRDAVKKSLDIFAPGGGFVFCQVHNIQADVPAKNIVSMLETLDIYGA